MFLSREDLLTLAHPLQRPSAIARWLDKIGIPYIRSPSGWPCVPQAYVDFGKPKDHNHRPKLHL
jgi:hypothetical protein